jgi:hypothetical protein
LGWHGRLARGLESGSKRGRGAGRSAGKHGWAARATPCGKRREKERGLGLHEGEVGELGAPGLALGTLDAVGEQVDADAILLGMLGGERGEIMAMAATDLQGQGPALRQRQAREKLVAQGGEALVADVGVEVERHGNANARKRGTHANTAAKVNAFSEGATPPFRLPPSRGHASCPERTDHVSSTPDLFLIRADLWNPWSI